IAFQTVRDDASPRTEYVAGRRGKNVFAVGDEELVLGGGRSQGGEKKNKVLREEKLTRLKRLAGGERLRSSAPNRTDSSHARSEIFASARSPRARSLGTKPNVFPKKSSLGSRSSAFSASGSPRSTAAPAWTRSRMRSSSRNARERTAPSHSPSR